MLWLETKKSTRVYVRKGLKAWLTSKGVQTEVEVQIKSTSGLFWPPGAVYVKTCLAIAYRFRIGWSLYVQKHKKKPFAMVLVSGPKSSEVIGKLVASCITAFWSLGFISCWSPLGRLQGVLHDPRSFTNSCHPSIRFGFCFSSIYIRTITNHRFVKLQLVSLIIHLQFVTVFESCVLLSSCFCSSFRR